MIAIRGATTIEKDEKDMIRLAVKELLTEIETKNSLSRSEIMSIVFSSTSDIHSYYPAKAAREAGFESCALFSATEPEIDGSLKLCIRVMLFVEKNLTPQHVYLHGASTLRKDVAKKYNVAIDGPAGSGKSTIAKALAADYRILYLDTGALYRAAALMAEDLNIDPVDAEKVSSMLEQLDITVNYEDGAQRTILNGTDVTNRLRSQSVTMGASAISKHPAVRTKLLDVQREIAKNTTCVLDGRDIGTVVLPSADFKFFLTADPDIRAKRRYDEMLAKGIEVDFDSLKKEIILRDKQDSTRAHAPLKKAEDAIEIDTSRLNIQEVLAIIKSKIQEKI